MDSLPEPWMRGPIDGVHPLLAPVLYSFQQAREDLRRWTDGLSPAQLWTTPHGFGSVGFHMRHIAGSTDRLMSYLQGKSLSAGQFATLQTEHEPGGAGRVELLALVERLSMTRKEWCGRSILRRCAKRAGWGANSFRPP
jgi:hypothetical protein